MERHEAEAITARSRDRLRDRYRLPVTIQQRETQRDPGYKGLSIWVARVLLPPPEGGDLGREILSIITCLGNGKETFHLPDVSSVEAEWVGYRPQLEAIDSKGEFSEREKYGRLMESVSSRLTIFFVHGGAFYLGSPATSRSVVAQLVKLSGARAFSVRYRLAPQNPFPAALLDLLVAYMSLLYPPIGSYHQAVCADSIVFTGESSGANLCLSLLQFLLELGRQQSTSIPIIRFNGKERSVPVPAGLASISAMADLTRALPSWQLETEYDIYGGGPAPYLHPDFPACSLWPSNPPRGEIYCDLSAICHPLVSPTAAQDWTGSPPMFICCGEERAADSNKIIAQRARAQGVVVMWEQFEAMSHLFMILMEKSPHSKRCYNDWATFCKNCVNFPEAQGSQGILVRVETLFKQHIDLDSLTSLSFKHALTLMEAAKERGRVWYGPRQIKNLL